MTNPPAYDLPDAALVTVDWLAAHLDNPDVRVLDSSWHLSDSGRDGRREYRERHIPGSGFFDLDAACDPDSALPHTMPSPAHFTAAMRQLGVSNDQTIVFYDTGGVHAAARARWMAQSFGHSRAKILDGGMAAWQAAGHAVENTLFLCPVGDFQASLQANSTAATEDVLAALDTGTAQIIDARSPARFSGSEPEPRDGVRPGHMPGAANIYFADLYDAGDRLRPVDQLADIFARAGISTNNDIITTCGSGVTACCLALALEVLGKKDVRIYGGSWSEWGGRHDLPIAADGVGTEGVAE